MATASNTSGTTLDAVLEALTGARTVAGRSDDVSITRPPNTTDYAAGDVVGTSTASGGAVHEFVSMGPEGGEVLVTSASLEIQSTGIISGETAYNLELYGVTPPSALADNAAFDIPAGDRAAHLCTVSLGAPVDKGSTLKVEVDNINKQIKLTGTSIFAYLVTVGAYTPTSGRVYVPKLHTIVV